MRKYGVNWLLYLVGLLVSSIPLLLFVNYIAELISPSPNIEAAVERIGGQVIGVLLQAAIWLYIARSQAQDKERAAQATEEKPFVGQTETSVTSNKPAALFTPRSRRWFGLICTLAGLLSVVAQVHTGKIGVAQVVSFTLGVPFCFVLGIYLIAKARDVTPPGTDRASTARQTAPTLAPNRAVILPQVEDTDAVVLSRRQ